ncbi:MAG: hypothetical protein R3266_15415, partial [Gemmatimonadota bacterium]|nr:hypothetical protein [Gemmatimonadota bacterium]
MKNLIREIHRRSLWQVLGVYLAGSWVALQVVEQLAEAAALPDWVRPFSLVLLILGFPIVMATAIVQEGVGGRERRESGSPADEPMDDPPAAEARPTLTPSAIEARPTSSSLRGLLTWKNAIAGGVLAFALLGVGTLAYMAMRTLGVGPAGTLVAK